MSDNATTKPFLTDVLELRRRAKEKIGQGPVTDNYEGDVEQTIDDNVKVLEWFIATLPDRNYRVLRREALKDGFLQQHVLEATLPDGTKWHMYACVVIKMENGLITRLDEYLDSAQGKALRAFGR